MADQYFDLAYKITGCAMEVHKHLGNGFQEVVYQRALSLEMNMQGTEHLREVEMPLFNKGYDIGLWRADFVVQGNFLVEIKALIDLEDVHLAQAKKYLTAYKIDTGLLINFGGLRLDRKRVYRQRAVV